MATDGPDLRVRLGGKDRTFPAGQEIVVGRDPSADVLSTNGYVSHKHARIFFEDGTWILEDTASKHGVYAQGSRVPRVVIATPTEVWLGEPNLGDHLELRPGPVSIPTAGEPPVTLGSAAQPSVPRGVQSLEPEELRPSSVFRRVKEVQRQTIAVVVALVVLAVIGVTAIVVSTGGDGAPPAEDVDAFVKPTIAYLTMDQRYAIYDKGNQQYLALNATSSTDTNTDKDHLTGSSCTGFVVNPDGYIATAAHCIDPDFARVSAIVQGVAWAEKIGYYGDVTDHDAILKLALDNWEVRGIDSNGELTGESFPDIHAAAHLEGLGDRQSEGIPADVVDFESALDGNDIALLKVDQTALPSLLLTPNDPTVGSEVTSVGYAGVVDDVTDDSSYDPSFKAGSVSSLRIQDGNRVYEVSAALQHGMSGGPTVDADGVVVGVNSFITEDPGFNFIRPGSLVGKMMERNSIQNVLAPGQEPPAASSGDAVTSVAIVALVLLLGTGVAWYVFKRRRGRIGLLSP